MQENSDFFAIFSLEDARVASYSLRAPHNATSVIGDPAEVEARIFARPLAKAKQVAERDINNTNNINQQQLRVQQHSTRSKDLLADGTARLDW